MICLLTFISFTFTKTKINNYLNYNRDKICFLPVKKVGKSEHPIFVEQKRTNYYYSNRMRTYRYFCYICNGREGHRLSDDSKVHSVTRLCS